MGGNRTGSRIWAGALLLAVQLVAAILLPLAHHDFDAASDHVEAPGSHSGGHNEAACHFCRQADTRFIQAVGVQASTRLDVRVLAESASPDPLLLSSRLLPTRAPRGPPIV